MPKEYPAKSLHRPQPQKPTTKKEEDVLRPKTPPSDVPPIGGEFTTSGTDKDNWIHPDHEGDAPVV